MKQKGLLICLFVVVVTMMSAGNASALINLFCDPFGCQVDAAMIADTARGLSCTGCVTSTMIQNMPLSLSVGSTNPIISATNTNSTQDATGVLGYAKATSGNTRGVSGLSDSIAGIGVLGHTTATTGINAGVSGESDSNSGTGVFGQTPATTGNTTGVSGESYSISGTGVFGHAPATTGNTTGVSGESDSISGIGVFGHAPATTGNTTGVSGQSNSPSGYGGHFENSNGGKALGAQVNSTEVMDVDLNGVHAGPGMTPTPIAHGFFDNVSGSRLSGSSNITCSWDSANLWYACTISGENFYFQSYTVNVTPTSLAIPVTGSANNQLLVQFYDIFGTRVKPGSGFSVTVFKQ